MPVDCSPRHLATTPSTSSSSRDRRTPKRLSSAGRGSTLVVNDVVRHVRHPRGIGAKIMARLFGFGQAAGIRVVRTLVGDKARCSRRNGEWSDTRLDASSPRTATIIRILRRWACSPRTRWRTSHAAQARSAHVHAWLSRRRRRHRLVPIRAVHPMLARRFRRAGSGHALLRGDVRRRARSRPPRSPRRRQSRSMPARRSTASMAGRDYVHLRQFVWRRRPRQGCRPGTVRIHRLDRGAPGKAPSRSRERRWIVISKAIGRRDPTARRMLLHRVDAGRRNGSDRLASRGARSFSHRPTSSHRPS